MGSLPNHHLSLTPEQTVQLAAWVHPGPAAADVELLVINGALIAGQGDDQAAWHWRPADDQSCIAEALSATPTTATARASRERQDMVASEIARIWNEVPDGEALSEQQAFEIAENAIELAKLIHPLPDRSPRRQAERHRVAIAPSSREYECGIAVVVTAGSPQQAANRAQQTIDESHDVRREFDVCDLETGEVDEGVKAQP